MLCNGGCKSSSFFIDYLVWCRFNSSNQVWASLRIVCESVWECQRWDALLMIGHSLISGHFLFPLVPISLVDMTCRTQKLYLWVHNSWTELNLKEIYFYFVVMKLDAETAAAKYILNISRTKLNDQFSSNLITFLFH